MEKITIFDGHLHSLKLFLYNPIISETYSFTSHVLDYNAELYLWSLVRRTNINKTKLKGISYEKGLHLYFRGI